MTYSFYLFVLSNKTTVEVPDSLQSGEYESILLQGFFYEEDFPFLSEVYPSTKLKFAGLRSQAYAKEFYKQQAPSGGHRQNQGAQRNFSPR